MGFNLKMLAECRVAQTLYYNHECHLELRECIHDHVEDLRQVYHKDDFLKLSDHWIRARAKYDELGHPEPAEQDIDLSVVVLGPERLHHDRAALEFTRGGDVDGGDTVHFHYRHQRVHLTKIDFYRLARLFSEGIRCFSKEYQETVKLSDPKVVIRQVAKETYLPWLKEYDEGKHPKEDPAAFWDMFLEMKDRIRPEELQRPDGGWLRDEPETRDVPRDFDRRYLFTMLECMRKYGYATGPFAHDLVCVQRDHEAGTLELAGSHRAACLVHLGYDEIPVIIANERPV